MQRLRMVNKWFSLLKSDSKVNFKRKKEIKWFCYFFVFFIWASQKQGKAGEVKAMVVYWIAIVYCIKGKTGKNLTKVGTFFLKKITFFVEVLQKQTKESVRIGMSV